MSENTTITVKLDVAGFYYGKTLAGVKKGATILDVMHRIAALGTDATDNGTRAALRFSSNHPRKFLDTIDISFTDTPKSRQVGQPNGYLNLTPGRYAASDFGQENVAITAGSAILAWQYYVNEATFENGKLKSIGSPLNGSATVPVGDRKIEPFGAYSLDRDCIVTWRLIVITTAGSPEEDVTYLDPRMVS
jgi:hypothetical protein